MLWSIECFDFNVLLFKEFCLLQFIECFKLLVSQNNNVCVCVCRWVGACMRACVHACVCVSVCTLLVLSIPCISAVFSSMFY